jgi:hypothetical protein
MDAFTSKLSANRIQKILKASDGGPSICNMHPECSATGGPALQSIARTIVSGRSSCEHLLYLTGFGLPSEPRIPLRLPALMIPCLQVLEAQRRVGLPLSRYRVYQATQFIAETNDISMDQAEAVSETMETFLRRYVHLCHPALEDHVEFSFGHRLTDAIRKSIESVSEEIRMILEDPACRGISNSLRCSEERHSRTNGHFHQYAAANVLYSNAVEHALSPHKSDISTLCTLPVGSRAERPFFALTRMCAARTGATVVPLFTDIGERPTYYLSSDHGDPESGEQSVSEDCAIRKDFAALEADGASLRTLNRIVPVVP